MSLEDDAQRLAEEQRNKNASVAAAAEARRVRMATPTPEGLEFVSFCHKHGVPPAPIKHGARRNWRGKIVVREGRGWPLNVYDGGSQSSPSLCVWADGTLVIVTGCGRYSLGEPVDPTDLPRWSESDGSLAEILAKAASNILIKKESGALYPPY